MKYAKRIPPVDEELKASLLGSGWVEIKGPSTLLSAILFSIPFMLFNVFTSFMIIYLLEPNLGQTILSFFPSGEWSLTIRFDYVIYLYLTVLIHELIHLVLIPGFLSSDKTLFGIKPWGGFVYTSEIINKKRFLLISVAPFIVISLILPFILSIGGFLNSFIIFLVLLNALASSVDIMNAFVFSIQVPGKAMIINNGFESYYRQTPVAG